MRTTIRALSALGLLALSVPSVSYAWDTYAYDDDYQEWTSDTSQWYDLYTVDYYLDDGTDDAFDGAGYFYTIDGVGSEEWYQDDYGSPTVNGNVLSSPVANLGMGYTELDVWQTWRHPLAGNHVRQTVFITNPTGADVVYDFNFESDVGSDSNTTILADSSGDAAVGPDDYWSVSYDTYGYDPHVGFIWGDGTNLVDRDPTLGDDDGYGYHSDYLELHWQQVTLAAGATIAYQVFYIQGWDQAEVDDEIAIIMGDWDAMAGDLTDEEIGWIANYNLTDWDGDGQIGVQYGGTDCDDADAAVQGPTIYYIDADGDGFGDSATSVEECSLPDGYAELDGDCDDAEAGANPDAAEICDDGFDNDCDGDSDIEDSDCDVTDPTGDDDDDDTTGDDDDDDTGGGGGGGGKDDSTCNGTGTVPMGGLWLLTLGLVAARRRS